MPPGSLLELKFTDVFNQSLLELVSVYSTCSSIQLNENVSEKIHKQVELVTIFNPTVK